MSKRFKDGNGDQFGNPEPIVDLTPESAVHPKHQGRNPEGGPTPLSVEETVEVLSEIDKLTAQIEELRRENYKLAADLEAKNADVAKPQGEGEASEAPSAESIEAKDKEIAELKDKYLRTLAEHENARRRIRQQSEESIKRQKENLLHDLLPVVDNLERAVEASKGKTDGKSIVEGVQMVLASLMDFLKANGVRPMASVGEPFDPNKHEAADHVPHSAHPPNTVVSEFHRGYHINEKVLRPARVVVSKGDSDGKGPKVE
jgi:molecular chaperone GrpE